MRTKAMATISSLGIGSGLDLSSIVTGLVDAERAPTENRLALKEQTITARLSAFGALKSSLSLFQGSMSNLLSSSTYNVKSASSSDSSVFSTSVTSNADNGNYTVEVSALAKSHSIATSAATVFADVNDTIGTGTLSIKFGTTTTGPYSFTQDASKATQTIEVSAANNNTTLSGMKDYINNGDFGISAAIVNDGSGYRLTLTSDNTGASNSMEISVTGDADGNNTDNVGLSQLAFNATAQSSMTQTVQAQDAALTINGLDITRDTNTVTGAIDGVTLNLLKADIGNIVNLSISENIDDLSTGIQEFVEGFNGLTETLSTLTSYDPETSSAGLLIGDATVRGIGYQLRSIIGNSVSELSGNIRSLADIGIKTTQDGTLDLDMSKLNTALASYPDEVASLFTLQGRPSDSDIHYLSATDNTQAGNYAVNITNMATKAVYSGTAVNNLTIDANNDAFQVKIDGVTSNSILLSQGVYTDGYDLAAHIQAQINNDANIRASGVGVTVVFDGVNFDISSLKYGADSKVEFTSVDTNFSNDIGFAVGSGIDGTDVAGTINGAVASGNGQVLTSSAGASQGLALLIESGSTGDRGSVSFSRGIVTALQDIISNYLDSDGLISNKEDGLNSDLDGISEQREKLNTRIASLEERLVAQFSALDSLIAQFNTTSSFLTQQLANLPKPNSIGNN
jgi:flagellar hook-associated protein 2